MSHFKTNVDAIDKNMNGLKFSSYSSIVGPPSSGKSMFLSHILKNAMIRLNEKHLLLSSLFYDIFSTIINFGLYISTRLRRSTRRWK